MPTYGTTENILDLLMTEMPEDMFASDRADNPDPNKRSISSSEMRANAVILRAAYDNMIQIYLNKFVSSTDESYLSRWEKDYFAEAQDQGASASTRMANILAKIRSNGGISLQVIEDIISGLFVGTGLTFDIVCLCGTSLDPGNLGAWILDESHLDVDTYLSSIDPNSYSGGFGGGGLNCETLGDYPPEIVAEIQEIAYTYLIRIYGNASAELLARIDKVATEFEPARSTHRIINNFTGPIPPGP